MPPHPNPLPNGEREQTAHVALLPQTNVLQGEVE